LGESDQVLCDHHPGTDINGSDERVHPDAGIIADFRFGEIIKNNLRFDVDVLPEFLEEMPQY